MNPMLNTAVALVGTKGVDFLRQRGKAADGGFHWAKTRKPDAPLDVALAALAVGPQAVSVFGPAALSAASASLETLYALHKARPWLDAVGVAALAAMAYRQGKHKLDGQWLTRGMSAIGGLRMAANFVTPPVAFNPHAEGRIVVTARELDRLLAPKDEVVGVVINGEARCWPLEVLRRPHVLHDAVGGQPVAATYCPLTRAAIVFRDAWRGHRLDLTPAGAPSNNVAFYEERSDGMIHQMAAAIGAGPHKGARLQTFPAFLTTWKAWKALNPETTGLWFETLPPTTALAKAMHWLEGLDAQREEPLLPVRGGIDGRLPAKAEVLGAWVGSEAIALSREALRERPVRELDLGGEPVVVLYDARKDMAMAYLRRVDGRVLSFEVAEHGDAVAADRETGRLWSVTGQAVDDGDDAWLRPVAHAVDRVRWYAWAHFHPTTSLVGEVTAQARQAKAEAGATDRESVEG